MARPKLGEGETTRLHVKMSAEEVEALDDWRFANRIASRSDAVRRLIQIGLVGSNNVDELHRETIDLLHIVSDSSENVLDDEIETASAKKLKDAYATLALMLVDLLRKSARIASMNIALASQITTLRRSAATVDDAMLEARTVAEALSKQLQNTKYGVRRDSK